MPKKKSIQLSVPTPCSEDWENMQPREQGRQCASCNKTIVDFSLFSDRQLVDFFNKTTGNICGRFNNLQLERQLVYMEPRNSFLYKLLFGTAISVGLAGSANANYNPNNKPLIEQKQYGLRGIEQKPEHEIAGGDTSHYVKITVVDSENGAVLPFASIILVYTGGKEVNRGTTDIDGSLRFDDLEQYDLKQLSIMVVYPGYQNGFVKGLPPQLTVHLKSTAKDSLVIAQTYTTGIVCRRPDNSNIIAKVYDSKTKKPITNANVTLLWNGKNESFAISDTIGNVTLNYPTEYSGLKFVVQVKLDGYRPFEEEIVAKKNSTDVLKVFLKPAKKSGK
ncbi:MAG TPA: carboxypeptidase regulatory-like domain-containing protein [Bacteroidia bacterium]|jgi:hypothetical protein|nr:carboxypeptidase regulatory-like domain-containing protein [Bacteroidia bacterium]